MSNTVWIAKAKAGADSFGHVWERAGAAIEVAAEHAAALLRIPDAGFSLAEPPDTDPLTEPGPNAEKVAETPPPPDDSVVTEPAPVKARAPRAAKAAKAEITE
jgi:hypothetical protein